MGHGDDGRPGGSRLTIFIRLDGDRGHDHGTFSLMLAPHENVPIVQLSLNVGMDPALRL